MLLHVRDAMDGAAPWPRLCVPAPRLHGLAAALLVGLGSFKGQQSVARPARPRLRGARRRRRRVRAGGRGYRWPSFHCCMDSRQLPSIHGLAPAMQQPCRSDAYTLTGFGRRIAPAPPVWFEGGLPRKGASRTSLTVLPARAAAATQAPAYWAARQQIARAPCRAPRAPPPANRRRLRTAGACLRSARSAVGALQEFFFL